MEIEIGARLGLAITFTAMFFATAVVIWALSKYK
jgi:hypothetical protein